MTCRLLASTASRLLLLTLVWGSSGCEVTPQKIQTWKNSVNGPPKIRACIRDTGQKLDVRVLAAEALVELGHVGPLGADLKSLKGSDQGKVVSGLVDKLLSKMKGQGSGRAQLGAKDALFAISPLLPAARKTKVTEAVVRWMLGDWGRRAGGEHSGQKIVTAAGKLAGPIIAEQIAADPARVVELAGLLASVGDAKSKAQGTAQLVALAKKKATGAVLEAIAKLGDATGRAFVLTRAQVGSTKQRQTALLALKSMPHLSLVKAMVALAGNAKEAGELRDAAFGVLGKIKQPGAAAGMVPLLTDKTDKKVVLYQAAESMIACCGSQGVAKLLEGLPSGYSYEKDAVKDFLEKDIKALGKSVVPVLRKALTSKSWIARLVAARVLGSIGSKGDVAALQQLVSDKTKLKGKGWKGGATLGSEARSALERLKKKK